MNARHFAPMVARRQREYEIARWQTAKPPKRAEHLTASAVHHLFTATSSFATGNIVLALFRGEIRRCEQCAWPKTNQKRDSKSAKKLPPQITSLLQMSFVFRAPPPPLESRRNPCSRIASQPMPIFAGIVGLSGESSDATCDVVAGGGGDFQNTIAIKRAVRALYRSELCRPRFCLPVARAPP